MKESAPPETLIRYKRAEVSLELPIDFLLWSLRELITIGARVLTYRSRRIALPSVGGKDGKGCCSGDAAGRGGCSRKGG